MLDQLAGERDRARGDLAAAMGKLRDLVADDRSDLLDRLHMSPPVRHGYRVLPRLDADAPVEPVRLSRSVYSLRAWAGAVPRLIGDIGALGRPVRVAGFDRPEKLVSRFEGLRKRLRLFERNIEYHTYWQQAVIDYPRFFATKNEIAVTARRLMDVQRKAPGSAQSTAAAARLRADIVERVATFRRTPGLAIRRAPGDRFVLPVTVVTDIQDAGFRARFRDAVEQAFSRSPAARQRRFEVALTLRVVAPATLYPAGAPNPGAAIDLKAHLARFPDDALVLTTGAESTHAFTGRYVALGPSPLSQRVLAHEFGHLLGFADAYLRSYRGAPDDAYGVAVIEWSGLVDDLMGAPGFGRVSATMIDTLISSYGDGARAL